MEMRQSLIDEEDELMDELAELKADGAVSIGAKSAQIPSSSSVNSAVFSSPGSVRTNMTSRHRNDLKQLERERKEQYEVKKMSKTRVFSLLESFPTLY